MRSIINNSWNGPPCLTGCVEQSHQSDSQPRRGYGTKPKVAQKQQPWALGHNLVEVVERFKYMSSFQDEIEPLKEAALNEFMASADLPMLEHAKSRWLGPQGKFTALMKQLGALPKEESPAAGKLINQAKTELEAALAERRATWNSKPPCPRSRPISLCPDAAAPLASCIRSPRSPRTSCAAFRKIGFAVADGPEIEDEYHCFDALNTPADHPARDSQDTFYLRDGVQRPVSKRGKMPAHFSARTLPRCKSA